jgi:hypothetical protein
MHSTTSLRIDAGQREVHPEARLADNGSDGQFINVHPVLADLHDRAGLYPCGTQWQNTG